MQQHKRRKKKTLGTFNDNIISTNNTGGYPMLLFFKHLTGLNSRTIIYYLFRAQVMLTYCIIFPCRYIMKVNINNIEYCNALLFLI